MNLGFRLFTNLASLVLHYRPDTFCKLGQFIDVFRGFRVQSPNEYFPVSLSLQYS